MHSYLRAWSLQMDPVIIVSAGKHFSNTNLSDLSIVGTHTECITKSCDPPDWLIQTC